MDKKEERDKSTDKEHRWPGAWAEALPGEPRGVPF